MAILTFTEVASTPTPPAAGQADLYIKTDNVVYTLSAGGIETPLGSSSSITSLTGAVMATGPGAAVATLNNSSVTGQALTGFVSGPNSTVLATDSILQGIEKLQAQVSGTSGTAITALTGDVSATGPGSATATVNSVGGSSAIDIHTTVLTVAAATSINTASTLVERDASGNFAANIITASLTGNVTGNVSGSSSTFTGSLSGDVTGTQSATSVVKIQGTSVNSTAPTDAQILVYQTGITAYKPVSISNEATMTDTGSVTLSTTAVTGKLLTGYTTGTNTPINATDTILQAFENLQAQVSGTTGSAITSLTGDVTATGPGAAAATVAAIQGNTVSGTTGTGNVVFSASPTLSGNVNISSLAASQAVVTDASKNLTSLIYTSGVTNSSIVSRDSAGNSSFNNAVIGVTTTISAGQTISMNYGSSGQQRVTGTSTVTFNLPDATTLTNGENYIFSNLSTQTITVYAHDGVTLIDTVLGGGLAVIECYNNSTTNGQWDSHKWLATGSTSGTSGTTLPGTFSAGNFSGSSSGTNTGDVTVTNTNSIDLAFTSGQTGLNATLNLSAASADAGNLKSTYSVKSDGLFIENPFGTPVNIGTSNMTGSASSFALSDHVHALTATVTTGQLLTGYTVGSNTPIAATDSILQAFEKTQGQINATTGAAITSLTGDVTATGPGAAAATVAKIQGTTVSGTTGTTNVVFSNSPTLVTPNLGTPSTLVLTNATGLPLTTGVTGTLPIANGGTNNSSAYTAGSIIFSNGTSLTQDNSKFYWDDTNFALGVGQTPQATSTITTLNTSGAAKPIWSFGYGVGSTTGLRGDFARGTVGTPAAAQAGDTLNFFSGRGYGTSQFATASTGAISVVAGETFTNTSNATYITFKTTPTGSVTSAEAMRINSTGNILMDTTTDNGVDILQIGSGLIASYEKLSGSVSGYIQQQAAATTTTYTVSWPAAQGGAGTYISNDGSGNLSWTNPLVNIDGGTANSNYTSSQYINGGSA